jgi:hypothetical protein
MGRKRGQVDTKKLLKKPETVERAAINAVLDTTYLPRLAHVYDNLFRIATCTNPKTYNAAVRAAEVMLRRYDSEYQRVLGMAKESGNSGADKVAKELRAVLEEGMNRGKVSISLSQITANVMPTNGNNPAKIIDTQPLEQTSNSKSDRPTQPG